MLDKGAMTELLGMEAVSVCKTLSGLLGRKCRISVEDIIEADADGLAEYLPRFNVSIEGTVEGDGLKLPQIYVFGRKETLQITNYIMGVPIDRESPLDEIALSTLKEVVSQSIGSSDAELEDLFGHGIRECFKEALVWDGTEQIQELVRRWGGSGQALLIRLHVDIEGVVSSDVFRVTSDKFSELFGLPEAGMEAASVKAPETFRKKGKAVPVQEVYFPEFKYSPIEYTEDHIGEDRKRLGEIQLEVSVRIGGTRCSVRDILDLKAGEVLTLDKQAGSPADILVNGNLIGRGDVLVSDDRFSTRIIEIIDKRE